MLKRKYLERTLNSKLDEISRLNSDLEIAKRNNELLSEENLALYGENKDLRFENEEQDELIKRLERLFNSNKYNNDKAVLEKAKELVRDYQSIN